MDRRSVHFTYQPTSRPPYYLRCFFFSCFFCCFLCCFFFARLFAHDIKADAPANTWASQCHRTLQNELFLALRMLRRRECRKDSRCSVNIYERLGNQFKQESSLSSSVTWIMPFPQYTRLRNPVDIFKIMQRSFSCVQCSLFSAFATFKDCSCWSYEQMFPRFISIRYYSAAAIKICSTLC